MPLLVVNSLSVYEILSASSNSLKRAIVCKIEMDRNMHESKNTDGRGTYKLVECHVTSIDSYLL